MERLSWLQPLKFIIVGVLNTAVGYGAYYVLLEWGHLHYMFALTLSHVIGVMHSYLWNSRWTFQAGRGNWAQAAKFLGVYALAYVLNLVLLYGLVRLLAWDELYAQAVALLTTTCISFIGQKYWSFKQ